MSIELFNYQEQQVKLGQEGKNINQSATGCGKTFVGLTIFKESNFKKLLILCLASKVQDFADDGKEVGLNITPLNKGTKKNKTLLDTNDCFSISFESSWRLTELAQFVDKDTMLLVDESHKLKSVTSKVSMFANKLSDKAGYSYIMTATLITNNHYENAWNQLYVAGVYKESFNKFKEDFCIEELQSVKVGQKTRYFNQITGYKNTKYLESLISQASVYKEREVDDELLPQDIFYYVKKPQMYTKLPKTRVVKTSSGEQIEYDTVPKLRHAMLQLCSGVLAGEDKVIKSDKLDRVNQILFQHEQQRIVIFYNYNIEKDQLIKLLTDIGRPWSIYNGQSHNLDEFKNNNDGVVLAQYMSASTGINDFVISSVAIFFSMTTSSTTYIQAKGRIDRHGQTKKPLYYHLIASNTIEQEAYKTVSEGKDFNDKLVDTILKSMGASDIK